MFICYFYVYLLLLCFPATIMFPCNHNKNDSFLSFHPAKHRLRAAIVLLRYYSDDKKITWYDLREKLPY